MIEHEPEPVSNGRFADAGPISALIPLVARMHRTLALAMLREIGLYPGQELLLMLLWDREPQSQIELARNLGIEPPTAGKTISRLEDAGMLARIRAPQDRRLLLVSLTPKGRSLREPVERIWAELERRTVDHLDPAQRRQLEGLLISIVDHLAVVDAQQ